MFQKKKTILSVLMACMMTLPSISVSAAITSGSATAASSATSTVTTSATSSTTSAVTTTGQAVSVTTTTSSSVKIADYGAHSITESGYENFDSSTAINNAIKDAASKNISTVDFGSGTYYAADIKLLSNITYISSGGATIKMKANTPVWHNLLGSIGGHDITLDGLKLDGNMDNVYGDGAKGSPLISLVMATNVNIQKCYLSNSKYVGIMLQGCSKVNIIHNTIYNTDCGVITLNSASNYLDIEENEIYGTKDWIYSEPIAIYNNMTGGYAHDITIKKNIVHDKPASLGIFVQNAKDVVIDSNEAYNCSAGICVSEQLKTNTLSKNIKIIGNKVHDNSSGIVVAGIECTVSGNTVSNSKMDGILVTTADGILSQNIAIKSNNITDSNLLRKTVTTSQAVSIHLLESNNCIAESNVITDDNTTPLQYNNINIQGGKYNIIKNNTLGNTSSGYKMYEHGGANTIFEGNISLLDQGTGTIVLNSGSTCPGGTNSSSQTITYGNPWGTTSDLVEISSSSSVAYNTLKGTTTPTGSGDWKGRQLTIKFNKVGPSITSGGNIKLVNNQNFVPTKAGATLTLVYDGVNWNEVFRNANATSTLDITKINTTIDDISATSSTTTDAAIKLLPTKVNVALSDGTSKDLDVQWISPFPTYDSKTNGTYVFIGRPTLTTGISNSTNREVAVHVIISDN